MAANPVLKHYGVVRLATGFIGQKIQGEHKIQNHEKELALAIVLSQDADS